MKKGGGRGVAAPPSTRGNGETETELNPKLDFYRASARVRPAGTGMWRDEPGGMVAIVFESYEERRGMVGNILETLRRAPRDGREHPRGL